METPLTQRFINRPEPMSLSEYVAAGGYQSVRNVLGSKTPDEVIQEVTDAGLRGRGGAGFATGVKWGFVPPLDQVPHPRYLVANADEMEPGTFKDRFLLEGCPHQLIEGMILAAYAIQANVATIFLRWAYKRAARLMERAILEAYQADLLGKDILGSGLDLDLHLHTSAGRYICGEETALLSSLEGRRAIPRNKPPFPPVVGLWGRPTVVQNVETLCNLPPIMDRGAAWYRGLGKGRNAGTKIFGVSGKVKRPGLWELPMGTTLREVLEDHAGGMLDGLGLRGLLPGGASTAFLLEEHLDLALDFEDMEAAGSRLGTGTIVVLDDGSCPVGAVHNLIRFFAQESCGFCTPCRDGLPWVEQTLRALEEGCGQAQDLDILDLHARLLGPGYTFCALAPGAVAPLASGLKHFHAEFAFHASGQKCPWR